MKSKDNCEGGKTSSATQISAERQLDKFLDLVARLIARAHVRQFAEVDNARKNLPNRSPAESPRQGNFDR